MRLHSVLLSAMIALTGWAATAAFAQDTSFAAGSYPARPIRLVVSFAPGGSSDTITRLIGPHLAE